VLTATTDTNGKATLYLYGRNWHVVRYMYEDFADGSEGAVFSKAEMVEPLTPPTALLYPPRGVLMGDHEMFCCGNMRLKQSSGRYPSGQLSQLAVQTNQNCSWLLTHSSLINLVHVIMTRNLLLQGDQITVEWTTNSELNRNGLQTMTWNSGPRPSDSINLTQTAKDVAMMRVVFQAGPYPRPLGSGSVLIWNTWFSTAAIYMIMMAVVIFVVAALILLAAMYMWRNARIWSRLYVFLSGAPPPPDVRDIPVMMEGGGGGANNTRRRRNGLPHRVLNMLPVYTLEADSEKVKQCKVDDEGCSICLCEYEQGMELRKLPCMHEFHNACITRCGCLSTILKLNSQVE
jgi:hypothetical protein